MSKNIENIKNTEKNKKISINKNRQNEKLTDRQKQTK